MHQSIIDALKQAGCTAEQILAAISAETALENEKQLERRYKATMIKRAQRNRKAEQNQQSCPPVSTGHIGTEKVLYTYGKDNILNFKKVSKKVSIQHSKSRGTRLPDDWQPSEDDKIFAAEHIPEDQICHKVDEFRDYWIAVPGAKGCKLNWSATWRNRIRNLKNRSSFTAKPTWRQKNEENLAKLQQYADSLPDDTQVGGELGQPDNPFIPSGHGGIPGLYRGPR